MLAKTSDVLARAGISSLKHLGQKLYDELGGATAATVLNKSLTVFANAYKSISMAANNGRSTEWEIRREEARLVSGCNTPPDAVYASNFAYVTKLVDRPRFMELKNGAGPTRFEKTLLGGMLGDIFAVQGIYAGADPELAYPLASILGESRNASGISTPLLSVLMLGWANGDRENYSLKRFANDKGLSHKDNRKDYNLLEGRLQNCARRLAGKGFLSYGSIKPTCKNIYAAIGNKSSAIAGVAKSSGMGVGRGAAVAVLEFIRNEQSDVRKIAKSLFYSPTYVQSIIGWLVGNGYVEICSGSPRDESSEMLTTERGSGLLKYLETPMSILGLHQKNKSRGILEPARIDVNRAVSYREELIDALHSDNGKRTAFERACKIAYRRHAGRA